MPSGRGMLSHSLLIVALLNVCAVLWRSSGGLYAWRHLSLTEDTEAAYSWVGDDYPLFYPMDPLGPASMTLQETVHFSLNANDTIAVNEWDTTRLHPKGNGFAWFGPEKRIMIPTFLHQLHCLNVISVAFTIPDHPFAAPRHLQHCFNYLRQMLLCGALDMLEAGDFMAKNYDTDRIGQTLVCEDWERLYEVIDGNNEAWFEWQARWT
ncbi:hypothetical protein BC834DRAFT_911153 [Gloeopeniophorella convolvens]|nr:hypothetical protein BC834DRAFT_911153 [Gloeopeniophorella convolvens]